VLPTYSVQVTLYSLRRNWNSASLMLQLSFLSFRSIHTWMLEVIGKVAESSTENDLASQMQKVSSSCYEMEVLKMSCSWRLLPLCLKGSIPGVWVREKTTFEIHVPEQEGNPLELNYNWVLLFSALGLTVQTHWPWDLNTLLAYHRYVFCRCTASNFSLMICSGCRKALLLLLLCM